MPIFISCLVCGKQFKAFPCKGAKPQRKYCGRKCLYASQNGRSMPKMPLEERFLLNVNKTESCWLWTGATVNGYGVLRRDYKNRPAHRLSWEIHFGTIPDGLFVLHDCDKNYQPGDKTYRKCVNPAHLWLGTHQQNMDDMVAKKRQRVGPRDPSIISRGEKHANAKLTKDAVEFIRKCNGSATSEEATNMATMFGVTVHAIRHVLYCQSWKHVT